MSVLCEHHCISYMHRAQSEIMMLHIPLLVACDDVRCDRIDVGSGSTPAVSAVILVILRLGAKAVVLAEIAVQGAVLVEVIVVCEAELLPVESVNDCTARHACKSKVSCCQ